MEKRGDDGLLCTLGHSEPGRIGAIDRSSLGLPKDITPTLHGSPGSETGSAVGEEPGGQVADTGLGDDGGRNRPEDGGQSDTGVDDSGVGRVGEPSELTGRGPKTPEDDRTEQPAI